MRGFRNHFFLVGFLPTLLFSQPCDKVIEWDLDDNTTKAELPYNQNLCFTIKSKKVPLDKIDDVFILEHAGSRGAKASIAYYADNVRQARRKFYALEDV